MGKETSRGKIFDLAPLAPVTLAFGAGIVAGGFSALPEEIACLLLVPAFALPLLAFFLRRHFSLFMVLPVFFSLGILFIGPYVSPGVPRGHIAAFIKEDGGGEARVVRAGSSLYDVVGRVVSEPRYRAGRTRLVVMAEMVRAGSSWQRVTGGVRLSVRGRLAGIDAGDRVRFLGHIRLPHNFGNPGEFDYVRWLRVRGIEALGYVRSPAWIEALRAGGRGAGNWVLEMGGAVRARINMLIDASGAPNAAILKALVTGDRGGITRQMRSAFSRAGLAHVLAISGLHVGIVAFFTYFVLSGLLRRSAFLVLRLDIRKAALLVSLPPVLAYGLMAGFSRPTERAVIMAAALVLGLVMNRGKTYYNYLALAGLVILAIAPASLYEASFQLSFMAVFFILYLSPRIRALLKGLAKKAEEDPLSVLDASQGVSSRPRVVLLRLGRRILVLASITLAASLGTWPLVAYHFGTVSTMGVFSNMLALPITTLCVAGLFVSAMVIPISASLATWGFYLMGWLAGGLLLVVRAFSALPLSAIHLSRPTPLEVVFVYVFIMALTSIRRARVFRVLLPLSAAMVLALAAYPGVEAALNPRLRVTFISVGQGDASLVELPDGRIMLIDGGGFGGGKGFDTGRGIIAPLLRYKKIRRVDYMVLSHAQYDHMGGLSYIAANFPVGQFWWNGRGSLGALGRVLERKGVPVLVLGDKGEVFRMGGVEVEVLPRPGGRAPGFNDNSLVLKLGYGSKSFIFTGDIEAPAEAVLVSNGGMRASVLKAPHHGSATGSTMNFLRAIAPEITVVSVGRGNGFGFPSAESLARYRAVGSRVFRTDLDGAVEVSTNGQDLVVRTYGR